MSIMDIVNRIERRLDERKPEIQHVLTTKYAWMSVSAVRAAGLKAATITTNDHGWVVASFADGQEEQIQANIKIPDDMNTDKDSYICLGWSSPAESLNCDWEVIYLVSAVGEVTEQAGATMQDFVTSHGTADSLVITYTPFKILAANVAATDMCIHIVVQRDGNDPLDTLGAVAELHGIAHQYSPR